MQTVLDVVTRAQAAYPGVTIEQFGAASSNRWFNDTIMKDFKRAEWTAVPLALGILLVVFGALVAATLPVVLALTAFFAANGLLALISHAMHVDTSASSVTLLMGLAVGVDYCLFYLRREREERAAGRDRRSALQIAAATSGPSVLISGLTVMVAMAGMFLSGMQLFAGFAVATISVVFIAMVGSVTVLLKFRKPVRTGFFGLYTREEHHGGKRLRHLRMGFRAGPMSACHVQSSPSPCCLLYRPGRIAGRAGRPGLAWTFSSSCAARDRARARTRWRGLSR